MSWTFDPTLTATIDQVRFLSGDVDTTDQQVANETITGLLTMYGSVFRAAAAVCRSLASRYSRQSDVAMDDMRKSLSQRAKAYAERASELEEQASSALGIGAVPMPFSGGMLDSVKQVQIDDPDRTQPLFTRDMMGTDTIIDDETA